MSLKITSVFLKDRFNQMKGPDKTDDQCLRELMDGYDHAGVSEVEGAHLARPVYSEFRGNLTCGAENFGACCQPCVQLGVDGKMVICKDLIMSGE